MIIENGKQEGDRGAGSGWRAPRHRGPIPHHSLKISK